MKSASLIKEGILTDILANHQIHYVLFMYFQSVTKDSKLQFTLIILPWYFDCIYGEGLFV